MKKLKKIPNFKTEKEEREFWVVFNILCHSINI